MDAAQIDAVLHIMADDAFVVLNWARRQSFRRDKQIEQVVAAYRRTLADTKVTLTEAVPA